MRAEWLNSLYFFVSFIFVIIGIFFVVLVWSFSSFEGLDEQALDAHAGVC